MLKRLIAYVCAATLIFGTTVYANDVDDSVSENDILEEMNLAESEDLEHLYAAQNGMLKVQITCYTETGHPTCTGSYRTEGVAAGKQEWLGAVGILYKVNSDGTVGEYLDTVEFNDVGYGAPIGSGTGSSLRKGKPAGTIETGKTIDIRRPNYNACVAYMKEAYTGEGTTGSEVYMQLVMGNG